MPIKRAIWTVAEKPAPFALGWLANEQPLEEILVADPRILSPEWTLIGRREITPFGGNRDVVAVSRA